MNDFFDNLPSVGQMFKLVMILLLAVIAVALVATIIKLLLPAIILAAMVAGGFYLYNRLRSQNSPA